MSLPETSARASGPPAGRLHFIDGLRGVAALSVALLHIYATSPVRPFMPELLGDVLGHGHLGVGIFFVLSGFVIANSLEGLRITPGTFGRFMARRLVRLHPPYVVSLVVAVAVVAVSNFALRDRVQPYPSAGLLVAHFFYLEDFLRLPKLNDVYWTLCLEIQFYLLFVLLIGLGQYWRRGTRVATEAPSGPPLIVFVPITLYGLALVAGARVVEPAGACFSAWHMFFGGALAFWFVHGRISAAVIGVFAAALAIVGGVRQDGMTIAALLTMGMLVLGCRRAAASAWLESRALQYLGAISYSLYLVHPFFGQRVANLGIRLIGTSPVASWILFFSAIACAIAGAHLFWRFVERPCIAWSRRIAVRAPAPSTAPVTAPASTVS